MDNQNKLSDRLKKLVTRRNILIVLGLVITVELIWALSAMWSVPKTTEMPNLPSKQDNGPIPTTISLESDKKDLRIGDEFTMRINLASDKKTYGTDIILNYNPQFLKVKESAVGQGPVSVGSFYDEYPSNTLDDKLGKIRISAISNKEGGELAQGELGTVTFVATKSGSTQVEIEFVRGSTSDTNILESTNGEDVLESVRNLSLTIKP